MYVEQVAKILFYIIKEANTRKLTDFFELEFKHMEDQKYINHTLFKLLKNCNRISQLAEIPPLYHDKLRLLNKEKG